MSNPANETVSDFLIQITNNLHSLLTTYTRSVYPHKNLELFFPLTLYILHFIIS